MLILMFRFHLRVATGGGPAVPRANLHRGAGRTWIGTNHHGTVIAAKFDGCDPLE
jgi:hypothetical protein